MSAAIWALSDLETPWCVYVVTTLRVAGHIEAGKTHINDLAGACGAHPESLHRVLRHLIGKGVFEEPAPGEFALNELARALLDPGIQLGFDLDSFGGRMAHAWSGMLEAVRTGAPAYDHVFGRPFWADMEEHPGLAAKFDALMGPAGHGVPDPEVLVDGGWESVRTVADIGGGTGSMLAEILRAQPGVRGILVDLPETVSRARATFEAAGVADRVTTVGQSFFDPLPAGADVYLLKRVLCDWGDAEALAILRRCAEAAGPTGRVVVVGTVSPEEGPGPVPSLMMMVLVGGKDRTLGEFRELAREAGLSVHATGRQPTGRFVVECRPGYPAR